MLNVKVGKVIKTIFKTFLHVSLASLLIKTIWITYQVVQGYREYDANIDRGNVMMSDYV